ncbi:hypothetical protein GUJ93_ZPchr0003g17596 [Zizania palustris]|uniref:Glycoside hydrolase family 9 domain-containing protein n=1 Tax=Zizania palustris TaxID=103762 RepID=A0A8J5RVV5_ZIZPA|nr:hypothetical protein GUJ93_ZPchr0003g17596 [Zizania palustris]
MSLIADDPEDSPRDCSTKHCTGGRGRRQALVAASSALASLLSLGLILWLTLRPSTVPRFSLLAATATATANASVVAINAAFAARNPNAHAAALYDRLQARVSYAGLPLSAPTLLPSLDQPPQQGDAVLSASLLSPPAADAVAGGRALLRLRVEEQLHWKVAAWVTGRHVLTVDCVFLIGRVLRLGERVAGEAAGAGDVLAFAKSQAGYILGSNPMNTSYLVGHARREGSG